MARYHKAIEIWDTETYSPSSGRPHNHRTGSYDGECRVFYYKITDIGQLRSSNCVLDKLQTENFDNSIGLYFYRHDNRKKPFIMIGACTDRPITEHIEYIWVPGGRKTGSGVKKSLEKTFSELELVREESPAYFVFYEMMAEEAAPAVDKANALEHHHTEFGYSTLSGDSKPRYPIATRLIWHDPAFQEVLSKKFPSNTYYR